jgi:hypothetical protein
MKRLEEEGKDDMASNNNLYDEFFNNDQDADNK